MATLLRSDRVRVVLLNATLLLLFASAWVSDRWPELALPAILIAFVVVVGEAILLYSLAKQVTSPAASQVASANAVFQEDYEKAFDLLASHRRHYALLRHQYSQNYALRPRASRVSTWALAALREDQLLYVALVREAEDWLARAPELRRPLTSELAKWKVVTHSDEAFNIVAGAFEIEYFHGRINIRILDSSRVTVEGETRGAISKVSPPGIRPPIYQ